eukprot:1072355-Ditylum_brightwellii.AAC.1
MKGYTRQQIKGAQAAQTLYAALVYSSELDYSLLVKPIKSRTVLLQYKTWMLHTVFGARISKH